MTDIEKILKESPGRFAHPLHGGSNFHYWFGWDRSNNAFCVAYEHKDDLNGSRFSFNGWISEFEMKSLYIPEWHFIDLTPFDEGWAKPIIDGKIKGLDKIFALPIVENN